ncbi:MAG: ACP S-malonyltransferase [Panacagrimonas sp.]
MKYAMLFPGQGSQAVGMLADCDPALVVRTFEEADEALGEKLSDLVTNGPAQTLNQTQHTQPALLAAGIAVWRQWQAQNPPQPVAMAGHSLGEYTALVAAGSLDFADALRLVRTRGQLMQSAVPEGSGGMSAVIGLDDEKISALCSQAPDGAVLEPVNFNAPGQVVVAGDIQGIQWLEANGKANGARMVKRLPVSVPSHCSLMQDAARQLQEKLSTLNILPPAIAVRHNLDMQARTDADGIRQALAAQLHQPVRWAGTIQSLADDGVRLFLECGPGKVLCGLNKRIVKDAESLNLDDPAKQQQALDALNH